MDAFTSDWLFSKTELEASPSIKCGMPFEYELYVRQKGSALITEMGKNLQFSWNTIITAIVYFQRFYMFHSFNKFYYKHMAMTSLFLSGKASNEFRPIALICKAAGQVKKHLFEVPNQDEIYFNESMLLRTLGFQTTVILPHFYIINCCEKLKFCYQLKKSSYFLATQTFMLTTMCLEYSSTTIACFCIYYVCQINKWELPHLENSKNWTFCIDASVQISLLQDLMKTFKATIKEHDSGITSHILEICKGVLYPTIILKDTNLNSNVCNLSENTKSSSIPTIMPIASTCKSKEDNNYHSSASESTITRNDDNVNLPAFGHNIIPVPSTSQVRLNAANAEQSLENWKKIGMATQSNKSKLDYSEGKFTLSSTCTNELSNMSFNIKRKPILEKEPIATTCVSKHDTDHRRLACKSDITGSGFNMSKPAFGYDINPVPSTSQQLQLNVPKMEHNLSNWRRIGTQNTGGKTTTSSTCFKNPLKNEVNVKRGASSSSSDVVSETNFSIMTKSCKASTSESVYQKSKTFTKRRHTHKFEAGENKVKKLILRNIAGEQSQSDNWQIFSSPLDRDTEEIAEDPNNIS